MAESKKRAADTDDPAQNKKPKFEKKSAFKKSAETQKGEKKPNPFQKSGKSSKCLHIIYGTDDTND